MRRYLTNSPGGKDKRPDRVAIVGAGPTGVLLAIELVRRGIEVRIFDKQPARSAETRAIGIHARTLEAFHQLGIVEQLLKLGHLSHEPVLTVVGAVEWNAESPAYELCVPSQPTTHSASHVRSR